MATYFERCDPYLELKRRLGNFINFYSDQKDIVGSITFSASVIAEGSENTRIYFPICRLYVLCPKDHLPLRSPWKELPDSHGVLRTKTPCKDDLGCAHSVAEWREGELPPFLCSLTQHLLEDFLLSLWRMPLKLVVKMDREPTIQSMVQQILYCTEQFKQNQTQKQNQNQEQKPLDTFVFRSSFLHLCPLAEPVQWMDDCYFISSVEVLHQGRWMRVSVLVVSDWALSNSCELSRENGLDVVLPHDIVIAFNRECRPIFSTEFGPLATAEHLDTLSAASWKSCMKALPNRHTLWIKTFQRPASMCLPVKSGITRSRASRCKRPTTTPRPTVRLIGPPSDRYHSC